MIDKLKLIYGNEVVEKKKGYFLVKRKYIIHEGNKIELDRFEDCIGYLGDWIVINGCVETYIKNFKTKEVIFIYHKKVTVYKDCIFAIIFNGRIARIILLDNERIRYYRDLEFIPGSYNSRHGRIIEVKNRDRKDTIVRFKINTKKWDVEEEYDR